jgi:hypothetical protein
MKKFLITLMLIIALCQTANSQSRNNIIYISKAVASHCSSNVSIPSMGLPKGSFKFCFLDFHMSYVNQMDVNDTPYYHDTYIAMSCDRGATLMNSDTGYKSTDCWPRYFTYDSVETRDTAYMGIKVTLVSCHVRIIMSNQALWVSPDPLSTNMDTYIYILTRTPENTSRSDKGWDTACFVYTHGVAVDGEYISKDSLGFKFPKTGIEQSPITPSAISNPTSSFLGEIFSVDGRRMGRNRAALPVGVYVVINDSRRASRFMVVR